MEEFHHGLHQPEADAASFPGQRLDNDAVHPNNQDTSVPTRYVDGHENTGALHHNRVYIVSNDPQTIRRRHSGVHHHQHAGSLPLAAARGLKHNNLALTTDNDDDGSTEKSPLTSKQYQQERSYRAIAPPSSAQQALQEPPFPPGKAKAAGGQATTASGAGIRPADSVVVNMPGPAQHDDSDKPAARALIVDLILRLQTTTKYRMLKALYFTFKLMDNLMLLAVLILLVVKAINKHESDIHIESPNEMQAAVLTAVVVELFYDVMLMANQFWILQRMSVWIGLELFAVYIALVLWIQNPLFIGIVLVRLAAYVLEELLDVAIDVEMHNDLIHLFGCCGSDQNRGPRHPHTWFSFMNVNPAHFDDMPYVPTAHFFRGSYLGWFPYVSSERSTTKRPYSNWIYLLYVPPFIFFFPFALALSIVVFVGGLLLLPFALCITDVRSLWREIKQL